MDLQNPFLPSDAESEIGPIDPQGRFVRPLDTHDALESRRLDPQGIDNLRGWPIGGIIAHARPHPPPQSGSPRRMLARLFW